MPKPLTISHPYIPGVTLYKARRQCPVPGFDLAFGDGVLWQGKPYCISSMHYRTEDFRPAASLVDYHGKTPGETIAPLDELTVFDDAQPYLPQP